MPGVARNIPITAVNTMSDTTRGLVSEQKARKRCATPAGRTWLVTRMGVRRGKKKSLARRARRAEAPRRRYARRRARAADRRRHWKSRRKTAAREKRRSAPRGVEARAREALSGPPSRPP